jgi:hypothetical protein
MPGERGNKKNTTTEVKPDHVDSERGQYKQARGTAVGHSAQCAQRRVTLARDMNVATGEDLGRGECRHRGYGFFFLDFWSLSMGFGM